MSFPAAARDQQSPVNYYHMWCNVKESRRDLEWAGHVRAYLDHLQAQGLIEGWSLTRRKFGFGPAALGEFHVTVRAKDLAQLDAAFSLVATRAGEVERLHAPVYSMVTDFISRLDRDFPDPQRLDPQRPDPQRPDGPLIDPQHPNPRA